MKLEIHQDASKNFNQKVEGLLSEFTRRPRPTHHRPEGPLDPDVHVAANFSPENIIGDIHIQPIDFFGTETAKVFAQGANLVGLFDESYKKLVRVAEAMQKAKALRDTVSVSLLVDLIFEWMTYKYQSAPVPPMAEHVLGECEKRLQEIEIWMPVFMLHVQSDVTVGRVTFKTITRAMLDEWRAGFLSQAPEEAVPAVEQFITKQRGRLQGFAAATIRLFAEPQRAEEIAFGEAERAVSLLRFFSPASYHPRVVSYCALLGQQHLDSYKYLTVKDGKISEYNSGAIDRTEPSWPLSTTKIGQLRSTGLDALSDLLNKDKRTEFQEGLLKAIQLYSKGSLAKDIADKLVYILVALESMFLKNSSEPIMDNISERMAFFAGSTVSERKAIISNVKKTYGLRSSFIHHGYRIGIDDEAVLREFMVTAWRCMQALIQFAANDSATKEKFLNDLEERKLS